MNQLADPHARRHSRLFVAALGLLSAFAPMSMDMYLPSLPTMVADLATDAARVQLTLSAFVIGFGAIPLLVGPTLDRFGRRSVLLTATLLYILASGACWLAADIDLLIGARLAQGIAAGCAPVAVRAMVRDTFEREDAARVMSLTMLMVSAAPLLAPILGGQLLVLFGWRSIFLTLAGFGALAAIIVLTVMPETLPAAMRRPLDWKSATGGYRQLLGSWRFMHYIMTGGLLFGAMFAYISSAPFVFIELYKVPADQFGYYFAINVAGMVVGASINSRLVRRVGSQRLFKFGTALAALAGIALLATTLIGGMGLAGILAPVALMTAALGLVAPNATAMALQDWPHMAGTAGALSGFMQFGTGALTGALVGHLHDGGALPMAATMAFCACCCFVVSRSSGTAPLPHS